jgi:hypothetical protein
MKLRIVFALCLCVSVAAFALPLLAQVAGDTPATAPPPIADMAVRVTAIAAMVATIVQGVKKIFPAIGGWVAIVLNILGAIAGTYAAAPAGMEILSIGFLMQTALAAFMAHGAHALVTAGAAKPTP